MEQNIESEWKTRGDFKKSLCLEEAVALDRTYGEAKFKITCESVS